MQAFPAPAARLSLARPHPVCILVSFRTHDKDGHMNYEVLDKYDRVQRGRVFGSASRAILTARGSDEVWAIADDAARTRLVRIWPEAIPLGPAAPDVEPDTPDVSECVGRAEREASAIIAMMRPYTMSRVHPALTVAWLKGFLAGQDRAIAKLDAIIAKYEGGTA